MTLKDYSFTFNPAKKGLRKILGDLEAEIMETLWNKGDLTVRQVHALFRERRQIAYTTIMTVMSRLADKGLLGKIKQGNAFIYHAKVSKDEFTQSTLKKVIQELLDDFTAPAISQFLESVEKVDPEKMEELAKIIEQKRKTKDV